MSSTGTGTPGRGLKRPTTPNQGQGQGHSNSKKRRFTAPYESPRGFKAVWNALGTAKSKVTNALWPPWGKGQGHGRVRGHARLDSEGEEERHHNGDMEDKE